MPKRWLMVASALSSARSRSICRSISALLSWFWLRIPMEDRLEPDERESRAVRAFAVVDDQQVELAEDDVGAVGVLDVLDPEVLQGLHVGRAVGDEPRVALAGGEQ